MEDEILSQLLDRPDILLFQKRVQGFRQVSKRKEQLQTSRLQAKWFYYFRAFEKLMKPEARVFEITSSREKSSLNCDLNKFSQFIYYI